MRKLVILAVAGVGLVGAGAWARFEATEADRQGGLEAGFESAAARAAERRAVAAALVNGDLSEDAAVDRFGALMAADPYGPPAELRRAHPDASDRELAARQLARFVRATGAGTAADLAGRLEAVADTRGSASGPAPDARQ